MKREKGAVTVEATISLTAFMFAIITLLTIVNICIVQARIATAIHLTAKEISQYSYLYSLTGFKDSQGNLYNAAAEGVSDIDSVIENVNTVFNEIENLGNTKNVSINNMDDISKVWNEKMGSIDAIKSAGSSLENTFESIAQDPKSLLFGIAKMAANDGLNLATSKLIAEPLSKIMCKKHLVSEKGGSVDSYLKYLGVVPASNGSYMDGLNFSGSTLFPNGSSEITVVVSYDVKVIALLPIDFKFHFKQEAITHGWLAGEASYQSADTYVANETLWTQATIQERASLIRHMVIDDLEDEGYEKTKGLTDVQLYNEDKNEFVMIASMNPLYTEDGAHPLTVGDLDEAAIREGIEKLCGKMKSTTDGETKVNTKNGEKNCSGAKKKIVLVIPEDTGLKEKYQKIIEEANTRGVEIEIVPGYGKGASASKEASGGES